MAAAGYFDLDGEFAPVQGSGGFEQITSLAASTALTVPAEARGAIITAETQNVRFRSDGTAPTATVGNLLNAGDTMALFGNIKRLRFIEAAASAKLNVTYLR